MSHCQATSLDLPRLSMTEVDRFLPARHCAGYTLRSLANSNAYASRTTTILTRWKSASDWRASNRL
jgi:hypothetical protein